MNDDLMKHFDDLNAAKQAADKAEDNRRKIAEDASIAANEKAHSIYKSILYPRIIEIKRELEKRGVCLNIIRVISMGRRKHNGISFHLTALGQEDRPHALKTPDYSIDIGDDGEVIVSRRILEAANFYTQNNKPEDLSDKIGHITSDKLNVSYIDNFVRLAIDNWFALQKEN